MREVYFKGVPAVPILFLLAGTVPRRKTELATKPRLCQHVQSKSKPNFETSRDCISKMPEDVYLCGTAQTESKRR